jgi:hypothetical protein
MTCVMFAMFLTSVRDDSDRCDVIDYYDVRKAYGVLDCDERYAVLSMISMMVMMSATSVMPIMAMNIVSPVMFLMTLMIMMIVGCRKWFSRQAGLCDYGMYLLLPHNSSKQYHSMP